MATHRQVQKELLDRYNRGDLSGHMLGRELSKTYFFSWATAVGETDFTHLATEATRLWFFQFQMSALARSCRTLVNVACPERYRLKVDGQKRANHSVELSILPGDEFSERIGYEIVDELEPVQCRARYHYDARAAIGAEMVEMAAALDLV